MAHAAATKEGEAVPWEMIDKAQGTQNKRTLARKGWGNGCKSHGMNLQFFFLSAEGYIIPLYHFYRPGPEIQPKKVGSF